MARLHSVERHTPLKLHGCHGALFPGPREVGVGSLGSTAFLSTEVSMEELPAMGVEIRAFLDYTYATSLG